MMEEQIRLGISVMPDPGSDGNKTRRLRETGRDVEYPVELPEGGKTSSRYERPTRQQRQFPKWQLDEASLAALLRALGPDVEQASRKYSNLRERLCRFFEWNRVDNADELADETLDRLARRLGRAETEKSDAGEDLSDGILGETVERPEQFATGIARLVLHEQRRHQLRSAQTLERVQRESETDRVAWRAEESRRTEERAAILDKCMAELSEEQQQLIRRYYSVEGRTMIDARKRLAHEMGISINALRNRALRIRAELESHVRSKLEEKD